MSNCWKSIQNETTFLGKNDENNVDDVDEKFLKLMEMLEKTKMENKLAQNSVRRWTLQITWQTDENLTICGKC